MGMAAPGPEFLGDRPDRSRVALPSPVGLRRWPADAHDPAAVGLVRAFTTAGHDDALQLAIALANHVLGVDTFFEWESDRS